jgi:hypothetical protein
MWPFDLLSRKEEKKRKDAQNSGQFRVIHQRETPIYAPAPEVRLLGPRQRAWLRELGISLPVAAYASVPHAQALRLASAPIPDISDRNNARKLSPDDLLPEMGRKSETGAGAVVAPIVEEDYRNLAYENEPTWKSQKTLEREERDALTLSGNLLTIGGLGPPREDFPGWLNDEPIKQADEVYHACVLTDQAAIVEYWEEPGATSAVEQLAKLAEEPMNDATVEVPAIIRSRHLVTESED